MVNYSFNLSRSGKESGGEMNPWTIAGILWLIIATLSEDDRAFRGIVFFMLLYIVILIAGLK